MTQQQTHADEPMILVNVPARLVAEVRERIAHASSGGHTALSYERRPDAAYVPWLLSWHGLLAAHAAILSMATAYVIIPACKNVFADFKTELMTITKLVLAFAYYVPWWAFWAMAVLWPIVCGALVRATPPERHAEVSKKLLILAILVGVAVAVFTGLGLLFPVVSLVGSIK